MSTVRKANPQDSAGRNGGESELDREDQRGLALIRQAREEYRAGQLETVSEADLKAALRLEAS